MTSAVKALSLNSSSAMDIDDPSQSACEDMLTSHDAGKTDKPKTKFYHIRTKQIKPLLSEISKLGQALAKLFGILVKVFSFYS